MTATSRKKVPITEHIATQRKWMQKCGGNRAGYILNYGSVRDENHSGDGGEAIFAADQAELDRLIELSKRRKYL